MMVSGEEVVEQPGLGDSDLVLGIDPGTAIMGYGLVRAISAPDSLGDYELVEYGAITTPAGTPLARRLLSIYGQLNELLERFHPAEVVLEELFFNKNTTTAIAVGQARGVALLAAASHNLTVREYTPLQVKQSLTGYGRATKDQIQQMVSLMLNLDYLPQPDDAADALALAICHLRGRRFIERLEAQQAEDDRY
jgi:crossover junction endodeoxyribonuclease RuvC